MEKVMNTQTSVNDGCVSLGKIIGLSEELTAENLWGNSLIRGHCEHLSFYQLAHQNVVEGKPFCLNLSEHGLCDQSV